MSTKREESESDDEAIGGDTPAADAAPGKAARPRKWRRRLVRTFLVLICLAILCRIAVPFVLPSVVESVAQGYGLTCSYEDVDLSVSTGEVRIWHLEVRPAPPDSESASESGGTENTAPTIVDLEYAAVDIDISALLTGSLRLHRVEVDGIDVRVEKDTDGELVLQKILAAHAAKNPTEAEAPDPEPEPEADSEAEPAPIDFRLPIQVDAARIQHARIRVLDPSVSPAIDTWLEVNVRISDAGSKERDTRIEVRVDGPDILDRFSIEGSVHTTADALQATFDVTATGLKPDPIRGLLQPFGLQPHSASLGLGTRAVVALTRNQTTPSTADVKIDLTQTGFHPEGQPSASIAEIHASARGLGSTRLIVDELRVRRVRATAERLADQTLRIAGFDLRPQPAPARNPEPEPAPDPKPGPTAEPDALAIEIGELRIEDVELRFADGAAQPPANLEVALDEMLVRAFATDRIDAPTEISIRGRAPGIFEKGELSAKLNPLAGTIQLSSSVSAERVTLERLRPYLKAAGVESTLKEGSVRCEIAATVATDDKTGTRAQLAITGFRWDDGEELLALDAVHVRDVVAAATGDRVRVREVEISGGRFPARRAEDGTIYALGLRTLVADAVPPAPAPANDPTTPGPAGDPGRATPRRAAGSDSAGSTPPTRFELERFHVHGMEARLLDESVTDKPEFVLHNVDLQIHDLAVGGSPAATGPDVASVQGHFGIEPIGEKFAIDGKLTSKKGPLDIAWDLSCNATGISNLPLAPYLADAGIEPTLKRGTLRATIHGSAKSDAARDAILAEVRIADVGYAPEEGEPFFAVHELSVPSIVLSADGVQTGPVLIDRPTLRITRAADGGIAVAGFRVPPPAKAGSSEAAPTVSPTPATSRSAAAAEPAAAEPAAEDPAPVYAVESFELRGARIAWSDQAVQPAVHTTATLGAQTEKLSSRPGAGAMPFELTMQLTDSVDSLRVHGSATLGEGRVEATARVDGKGLRAGPLTAYVPPEMSVDLKDGQLALALRGELLTKGSSRSMQFAIEDFTFRDGDAPPLAAFSAIRVDIAELDAEKRRLRIAEVATSGLEVSIERTADAMRMLGVSFRQTTENAAPAPVQAGGRPKPTDVRAVPAALKKGKPKLWRIELAKLDLGIDHLRFVDRSTATDLSTGAAPRAIDSKLRVQNLGNWILLDERPEDLAPLKLRISGAADPLVESLAIDITAAPFHADSELDMQIAITGIRGADLASVLPGMEEIDASELRDGSFTATVKAHLNTRRRHALDFDLSRGFRANLDVTGIALKGDRDGQILLGLDALSIDAPRITTAGDVHIASIELTNPRGRVWKDAKGLHVAGLIRPPPPEDPAAETPTDRPEAGAPKPANPNVSAPEAADPKAAEPEAGDPDATPSPEFRVDLIAVQGIDFEYRDEVADPPLVLPLNQLDIDIRKFTTRAFRETLPVKFSFNLESGKVELPQRIKYSSALAGTVSGLGNLVVGNKDKVKNEERRLLDEVSIAGKLSFYPDLKGTIRTNIRGLELSALRGPAARSGVTISDGVFDAGVKTDFESSRSVHSRAKVTIGHLSIEEESGGPISSYLKLPAPLQTVVFALRDDVGDISIPPLDIPIEGENVSGAAISTAIAKALSTIVVNAIAAAPLRVTGTVTDLIGLTGNEKIDLEALQQKITFATADAALPPTATEKIRAIADSLDDEERLVVVLRHEFGSTDMVRAALLANPTREQARALVHRLRQQRTELLRRHAELAAAALAQHAVGQTGIVEATTAELRRVTEEMGETEDAIDEVADLLRPGAERRTERRTRRMAQGIGEERISAVRDALARIDDGALEGRIEVRRVRIGETPEKNGSILLIPKIREVREEKGRE